jgi:hypothetical protein
MRESCAALRTQEDGGTQALRGAYWTMSNGAA